MAKLVGWVPDYLIPRECLDSEIETEEYMIHYNNEDSAQAMIARTIAEKYLVPISQKYSLPQVHIYLYLINYYHDYEKALTRENCNNGYTVSYGNKSFYIVVFRRLFWPKVLIHEILHVLWISTSLPIIEVIPKFDESIIEKLAVMNAVKGGFIDGDHYTHFLEKSRETVMRVHGGKPEILNSQKSSVYEYLFFDDVISDNQLMMRFFHDLLISLNKPVRS